MYITFICKISQETVQHVYVKQQSEDKQIINSYIVQLSKSENVLNFIQNMSLSEHNLNAKIFLNNQLHNKQNTIKKNILILVTNHLPFSLRSPV